MVNEINIFCIFYLFCTFIENFFELQPSATTTTVASSASLGTNITTVPLDHGAQLQMSNVDLLSSVVNQTAILESNPSDGTTSGLQILQPLMDHGMVVDQSAYHGLVDMEQLNIAEDILVSSHDQSVANTIEISAEQVSDCLFSFEIFHILKFLFLAVKSTFY